jgi:uncharacterized nucleotidyltransferase DUF6036
MFRIFVELFYALNARRVRYLIVGGYAVIFHARAACHKDLDILIKADPRNAAAVYAALQEFGAPVRNLGPSDFAQPGFFFRMGRPPQAVDILLDVSGVDFDDAWSRRVRTVVDPETRLKANIISADDLIAAKLASGRPQDLADVAALREARESRQQKPKKRKRTTAPSR